MKKNIDELLNDFIDNQLSSKELDELNHLIANDSQVAQKLQALRSVNSILPKLEASSAPIGFTEKLMEKLGSVSSKRIEKEKRVVYAVVGLFSIIITALIVFVLTNVNLKMGGGVQLSSYIEKSKEGIESVGLPAVSFFKNKTIMMISASTLLVMLILAYFSFESHKNMKRKINSYSHM